MIHPLRLNTLPLPFARKKNEKEGMFAGNKNPAIQQYLSQRADEMCQMQPGLNVKLSPGDAEKQAG